MRIAITNGRVIDPDQGIDAEMELYIADGLIAALGAPPDGFVAERTLDARGCWVIPGAVDLAARLREPGHEHKATIASETHAAAAAGVTSLCCPPDTEPVIDTPAQVELIHRRAAAASGIHVYTLGALTTGLDGRHLSEMAALRRAGCVGVSNALQPLAGTLVLRQAMEYAGSHGLTAHLHPVDFDLAGRGCAHEGAVASRLGLPAVPQAAETAALGQILALIQQTGVRTHFCRLSSARGVAMIREARRDGLPVTADVCAHQLFLTDQDLVDFNTLCHTFPPLRSEADRDALREGLVDGTLDAVCSDHQPHEPDAKLAPFAETIPGISALETLLPLTMALVTGNQLSHSQAVARVTRAPARILGVEAGDLRPGSIADVCVFDPNERWQVRPGSLYSAGCNTPFMGRELSGRTRYTLAEGQLVFAAGEPA